MRASHAYLCSFTGKRCKGDQFVPPGTECDRQGCARQAKGYLLFPWGANALCGPHLLEDMEPTKWHRVRAEGSR